MSLEQNKKKKTTGPTHLSASFKAIWRNPYNMKEYIIRELGLFTERTPGLPQACCSSQSSGRTDWQFLPSVLTSSLSGVSATVWQTDRNSLWSTVQSNTICQQLLRPLVPTVSRAVSNSYWTMRDEQHSPSNVLLCRGCTILHPNTDWPHPPGEAKPSKALMELQCILFTHDVVWVMMCTSQALIMRVTHHTDLYCFRSCCSSFWASMSCSATEDACRGPWFCKALLLGFLLSAVNWSQISLHTGGLLRIVSIIHPPPPQPALKPLPSHSKDSLFSFHRLTVQGHFNRYNAAQITSWMVLVTYFARFFYSHSNLGQSVPNKWGESFWHALI